METSFFEAEGHRAKVQQRWSTEQWATQTFKKYKMGHVIEKVENHLARGILFGISHLLIIIKLVASFLSFILHLQHIPKLSISDLVFGTFSSKQGVARNSQSGAVLEVWGRSVQRFKIL